MESFESGNMEVLERSDIKLPSWSEIEEGEALKNEYFPNIKNIFSLVDEYMYWNPQCTPPISFANRKIAETISHPQKVALYNYLSSWNYDFLTWERFKEKRKKRRLKLKEVLAHLPEIIDLLLHWKLPLGWMAYDKEFVDLEKDKEFEFGKKLLK